MIFFDEAGNSGGNLLDKAQPTYLLLSHNYTAEEAKQILQELLETSKAKELHFSRVKKYGNLRTKLLNCLNHPLIQPDRICYYVAHKEFMIAIQLIDQLVEPVFHSKGIDIYQYGTNLSSANMLHILGTALFEKPLYENMCTLFVKFMRDPKRENCMQFYKAVETLRKTVPATEGILLDYIIWSSEHLSEITTSLDKYTLDATLSCFNAHCQYWAKLYNKPFDIVFDNSKQITYWTDMIDFLTNHLPEEEVGYGSRKYKYPLLINNLQQMDSKEHIQIQLSDIFASSLNHMFTNWARGTEDEFSEQIDKTSLHINAHELKMWPTQMVTPEALDMTDGSGTNPLDFFLAASRKSDEASRKFSGG